MFGLFNKNERVLLSDGQIVVIHDAPLKKKGSDKLIPGMILFTSDELVMFMSKGYDSPFDEAIAIRDALIRFSEYRNAPMRKLNEMREGAVLTKEQHDEFCKEIRK